MNPPRCDELDYIHFLAQSESFGHRQAFAFGFASISAVGGLSFEGRGELV